MRAQLCHETLAPASRLSRRLGNGRMATGGLEPKPSLADLATGQTVILSGWIHALDEREAHVPRGGRG